MRIPVQHGCDHRLARQLLEEVLREVCTEDLIRESRLAWQQLVRRYLLENASLEPAVTLMITDNWLEFTLRYLVDYKQRRSTRDRLAMGMLDAFANSSGAVTLGSATLKLVEPDTLDVRLRPD